MVEVIVIPDGAAEDPRRGPTSLERARTPVLDAICAQGCVSVVRTIPEGLPSGSEVGIPTLLGVELSGAPSRGQIEAAAAGIAVPDGMRAFRVDLPRGHLAPATVDGLWHLRGHRYLFVGKSAPTLPEPWRIWAYGAPLPKIFDESTVVVSGPGAGAGCGRLLGARVIIPKGTTGDLDTDYRAKAEAALSVIGAAKRVIIHIGAPDEASHDRDPDGKVAALDAIDAEIVRPIFDAVARRGGTFVVCPDHGTDPSTGEHLTDPVPSLRWARGIDPSGPPRLVERDLLAMVRP